MLKTISGYQASVRGWSEILYKFSVKTGGKMTRLTIICISFIFISLMFAGQSYAEVDPETIVGVWLFDEGSGEVALDYSGNGNDGTLNGPEWTNESKFGGALEFDGAGSYIEFATGESMKTQQLTFMAWFNTRKLDGYGHIFQTGTDWNDIAGCVFRVHQDGHAQAALAHAPGNTATWLDGPAFEADTWYHMVLTYDGTTATLYLDGVNVASGDGQGEIMYDDQPVRIGTHSHDTGAAFDGFIDEVALFDVALEAEDIEAIMNSGLSGILGDQPLASRPNPKDGSLILDTWVNLAWSPGDFAVSHDIYIGENFEDVDAGAESTFQGNQAGTFIVAGFPGFPKPEGLVPGTTYYWRIDEVNEAQADSPWKGEIWSFSIAPRTAYDPLPADSAESVSVDVKLSWTEGFGGKLHTVYFGDDFDQVSNAAGGQAQGTTDYDPGTLEMAKTYYWRVDEFDIVETHKGNVWSFTTEGAVAALDPANSAVGVSQTPNLTWIPGVFADTHEVYFGTDTASLDLKGSGNLGSESFEPGQLEWNTTYYWRIDEANNANADSPWTGPLWSFTTANFLIIDDMESYNDIDEGQPASNRIYLAWVDGFDNPTTNGSTVGHLSPPFAEMTIVHSGNQSMPFAYNNAVGKSEATLTLASNRDWTVNGINTLTIWFRGEGANTAEPMYVALNDSAVVTHDNPDAALTRNWSQWNIDLQAFADQGVNLANVNSITLGVGNRSNPVAGGAGMLYFDDIRLYTLSQ
ncbi:MAG: LamG domain-containing protein [Planctomycetes bacterium]|nr:LamG domain-containing protein [Planctomycetota bacterium]